MALGAKLFDRAVGGFRPGVKEVEVAAEMELAARRGGAEEMSFPTIIASGATVSPASWAGLGPAIPRRRVRRLRLRCYTFRLLFGPDPHCVGGLVPEDARRAYDAVREAQQAAIEAVRPGFTVGEVDAAARKVLQKAGLGQLLHALDRARVGLEIHEIPRVAMDRERFCSPGWSLRSSPEYTSPANGA